MNNYKIRVNNEAESREARNLFCELGFTPDSSGYGKYVAWVAVFADGSGSFYSSNTNLNECQELTLPQLHDLVAQSKSNEQGLISGADAKLAWAKGEDLQIDTGVGFEDLTDNYYLAVFDRESNKFRLKPRTVKLEIEVPAPFEPKVGERYWFVCLNIKDRYASTENQNLTCDRYRIEFGVYRTEAEIKIVVEQLRKLKEHSK